MRRLPKNNKKKEKKKEKYFKQCLFQLKVSVDFPL